MKKYETCKRCGRYQSLCKTHFYYTLTGWRTDICHHCNDNRRSNRKAICEHCGIELPLDKSNFQKLPNGNWNYEYCLHCQLKLYLEYKPQINALDAQTRHKTSNKQFMILCIDCGASFAKTSQARFKDGLCNDCRQWKKKQGE